MRDVNIQEDRAVLLNMQMTRAKHFTYLGGGGGGGYTDRIMF